MDLVQLNVPVPSKYKEQANKYFKDIFCKLPKNTQKSYVSDLRCFYRYCFLNNLPGLTENPESTEECIKSFVTSMCGSQLTYKTIYHRLATLSKFMQIAKLPNPIKESEYLRTFIKLELKEHDILNRAKQAPALRIETLNEINTRFKPQKLIDYRDLAIINVMFDALLRADEVVSIQIKHINVEHHSLLVPTSKADQTGVGSLRYLSKTSIELISNYIEQANIDPKTKTSKLSTDNTCIKSGILFRRLSPKGTTMLPYDESITRTSEMPVLNYTTVFRLLKRVAKKAYVDIDITGHSARVGGAVSMAESGVPIDKIQKAGGWKTVDMPALYTEQARVESGMSKLADKFNR